MVPYASPNDVLFRKVPPLSLSAFNRFGFLLITVSWVLPAPHCLAKDYFLTLGGGYEPSGNQVSLEKNVQFFQRTLHRLGHGPANHMILFSDGRSIERDLQYNELSAEISPATEWMTRIMGDESQLHRRYRDHQVSPVFGSLRLAWIDEAFQTLNSQLQDGDRLIVYATAHGGPAESESGDYSESASTGGTRKTRNTTLSLWNDESITVQQWTKHLDRLPPNVDVIMVMVQCYSGGFAQSIFNHGDFEQGLSPRRRCGFFSQVHDRPAAGCTAEVNEVDYQEYSSFFWAALGGVTRTGESIPSCDYDSSGMVTLNEAHAYAVIHSDNIDIPVQTSGELLRRVSKLGKPQTVATSTDKPAERTTLSGLIGLLGGDDEISIEPREPQLLSLSETIQSVHSLASPDQQAIIDALVAKLQIDTNQPCLSVQRLCSKQKKQVDTSESRYVALSDKAATTREALVEALQTRWPELDQTGYSPIITTLTTTLAEEFMTTIESLPESSAWEAVEARVAEVGERLEHDERQEALARRLLRTIQDVLLEANLPQVAPQEVCDRFKDLEKLQSTGLAIAGG